MILNCPNCNARVQLDEAKIPASAFRIRCPKCDNAFEVQPPPKQQATPPLIETAHETVSSIPSAYESNPPHDAQNLLRMLTALLQQSSGTATFKKDEELKVHHVMICATPAPRDAITRALNGIYNNTRYELSVAADTAHAVDSLREERCNVLMLDSEFEAAQKGAAFIKREIYTFRPAQRRRLFIVYLSSGARTADAHEAFINHVNLVVSYSDIPKIPQTLERAMRDFNDLYRDFYVAQKAMSF